MEQKIDHNEALELFYDFAHLDDDQVERLGEIGFPDAPASKGHHLACPRGLERHSVNVTKRLVAITKALDVDWSRPESPYLVGMLHDLVKCKCYRLNDDGRTYRYVQPDWPGHGVASVMIATFDLGIQLNADEAAAITWHMGAFGLQGRALDEFDAALDRWPSQIIATHTADWAAARIDENGTWTEERTVKQ